MATIPPITVEVKQPPPFALIRRNPDTAARLVEILGLPSVDGFLGLTVEFGIDGIATAHVELALSPDQLAAVAALAEPIGS